MNIQCPQCGQSATAGTSNSYSQHLHHIPFQCNNPACQCRFTGTLELTQARNSSNNRFNAQHEQAIETDC